MNKAKNITFILSSSFLVIGILITMGFSNKKQDLLPFSHLEVSINHDENLFFLETKDVKQLLYDTGDSIINSKKIAVNIPTIEADLNKHQNIENAEVYATIDGKLKVKIIQRKPIIRVITKTNQSYYIDSKGMLMPLSEKYTAKVILANGNIDAPYELNSSQAVNIQTNDSVKNSVILGELFAIASYIHADSLWNSQIKQMYVNSENDIELTPLIGNHKIIFGDTISMDEKFKKLYTFYTEGLNTTGWWDKYSIINLKYNKQIVCTKK